MAVIVSALMITLVLTAQCLHLAMLFWIAADTETPQI
jgi:hypothetical protein